MMMSRKCPVCGKAKDQLLHPRLNSQDFDIVLCIFEHVPNWSEEAGICPICLSYMTERAQHTPQCMP
jgi:hypothetical protein